MRDASDRTEWARQAFFERRIVLLTGAIDRDVIGRAAAELMLLDGTGDEAVELHIDASGGTADDALVLIDVVDLMGVPVTAWCRGRAEGAAAVVLACAPRRLAAPHATVRFTLDSHDVSGDATALVRWAEHHAGQHDRLAERLAASLRRPRPEARALLDDPRPLDVDAALARGVLDAVEGRLAPVHHLPRRIGFHIR